MAERGWGPGDFARATGANPSQVWRWRNRVTRPRSTTLPELAQRLDIPVHELASLIYTEPPADRPNPTG